MDECWITTWTKDRKGYGYQALEPGRGKKRYFAHRVAYATAHGLLVDELPESLVVRHTCDNPPCVNPKHLIEGTTFDNVQDRVDRDRSARGVSHGSAKLTEQDVIEIRSSIQSRKELAEIYGVHQVTIGKILLRQKWTHI